MSAADAALLQQAALFALLLVRVLPLCLLAPFLAVGRAPLALSLAIALGLALCLWPAAQAAAPELPLSLLGLALLGVRELLLGLLYALAFALPLRAFEWAGALTGRFAFAGADPAYGRLQLLLACAAFFTLGGARLAIATLAEAVARRPIGVLADFAPPAIVWPALRLFADAFATALLLAAPVALALLLAEFALAIAARAAAGSALALVVAPARAVLALVVVCMAMRVLLGLLPEHFARGLSAAARLLGAP